MKKILSFLQKKPLAIAAVALMGMVPFVFAEETGEGEAAKPATDQVWTKVADGTTLKPFEKVTFVDTKFKKIYNGYHKVVTYEGENPSTEAQGQGFWVVDGFAPESPEDVAIFPESSWAFRVEGEEVEKGPYTYLTQEAELQTRQLNAVVSWDKDAIGQGMVRTIHAQYKKYIYYDEGLDYFTWTENQAFVDLFKQTELARPVFDPQSSAIWIDPEATAEPSINISIPGIGKNDPVGSISWKQDDGDYNDGNGTTTDVTPDYEDGVPVEITAKNVYEGGETQEVTETYTFVTIAKPVIKPASTTLTIKEDGTISEEVEITEETEGATILYYVEEVKDKTAEAGEETKPTFSEYTDKLDLSEYVGKTVRVVAKATKGGVETSEVSETYTIEAYPAPQGVVFKANPEPEATVDLGSDILLWFEVEDGYGVEYDPTPEANQKLTLTFEDGSKEIVDVKIAENGKVSITVPADKKYADSYFTFTVPEGFYYTYTGGDKVKANQVPTPVQENVKYYTGKFASVWVIDCDEVPGEPIDPNKYLTTDDNTCTFQVYPKALGPDAEVDFANPDDADPTHGAQFTYSDNTDTTPIISVEKVTKDEKGNPLPNTFMVTFYNPEGKAEYIERYLKNALLEENGFHLGFPTGTFVSEEYTNGPNLSANIFFTEAVDLVVEPIKKLACEGGYFVDVKVTATGKVLDTDYNTAYDSDEESRVVVDPEQIVTIVGTTIYEEEEEGTATIRQLNPANEKEAAILKKQGIKEVYRLAYPSFRDREEDPIRDADRYLREDNGTPYTVTLPKGTFTINMSKVPEVTFPLDVAAHPVWAATAQPYSYDEGKKSASTITLDLTATLDDVEKKFENNVNYYDLDESGQPKPEKMTVVSKDGKEHKVKSWTLTNVSDPYVTEFAWKDSYSPRETVKEKYAPLEGTDVMEESFVVTLTLEDPIEDAEVYDIVIAEGSFAANRCPNDEIKLSVYPQVNYFIETKYYSISTDVKSVEYYIAAVLPDGSPLDEEIKYVGETGEGKTEWNALAYNDALNDTAEPKYPTVTATVLGSTDAKFTGIDKYLADEYKGKAIPATLFTITFNEEEGKLIPNNYKMNFAGETGEEGHAGTVQAEGYNPNLWDLYNNFQVVSALDFDATSNEDHYNNPATQPKDKDYYISTSTKQITLYLTAVDKYDKSDANKSIELEEGTELLLEDQEGKVTWKRVKDGIYTVTFIDENGDPTGLAENKYKLTVPAETVVNNTVYPGADPKVGVKNPEKFDLWIYVEDFEAPEDVVVITTKDWEIPVEIDNLTKVVEGAKGTIDGKEVVLSSDEAGKLTATLPYDKTTGYDFLHSGDYTLTIPKGSYEGNVTTNYVDIPVTVKVMYQFIDYGTTLKDDKDNSLTSTKEDVNDEVGYSDVMRFTREFTNQNLQALAVPFDIKQKDVAKYFTIYKADFVRVNPDDPDSYKLNYISIGEDATAYANTPYLIIPTKKAESEGIVSIDFESVVQTPKPADNINCRTTTVNFDIINTIEETKVTDDDWFNLTQGKIHKTTTETIPEWRWYIDPSDRTDVKYIKIAINGVDIDDADGIDFVEAAEGETQIFNVAGQRLNAPAKGKVNIINGKKVFVK